ncbi:MAG: serine hydrolase, partial [Paramuribaculum sp.]|nr:serine hydrolase [Paramuribaculum sp.]
MKKIISAAVVLLFLSAPTFIAPAFTPEALANKKPALVHGREAVQWADSVMGTLSLRQKVGQLFVPRLDVFDNPAGHAALKKMVTTGEVGGFLLGKGTVAGYTSLIKGAQEAAKIPLMVTLDGEWGLAMRLTDAPRFPYNMGLGAISDPQLLYDYGREVARECREVGITVNFAPVLDVNSNPANPVIGYRSFGENPQRVAALGLAFSRGLEDGGVMAVGKHFPGHGDTSVDSHKALPTVDHTSEQLQNVDLVPFRDFIDNGLGGIMVGHLKVPVLDASGTPASLSHKVSTDLLKKQLGFEGLVFTDALAMKGAVTKAGENNCVAALKAGADVLLGSGAPYTDIEAVVAAVKSGKISEERVNESCKKILMSKYQLGLSKKPSIAAAGVTKRVNSSQSAVVNERLAKGSITIVKDADRLLPIGNLGRSDIAVVSIGAPKANDFSTYCAKYAKVTEYSVGQNGLTQSQLAEISGADVIIIGVFSNSSWAAQAFASLASKNSTVGVLFMNPYKMAALKTGIAKVGAFVAAYDDTPALRKAAAEALFGGIDVTGRFPVNVAGVAKEGEGISISKSRLGYSTPQDKGFAPDFEKKIDSVATVCLAAGAFPGCQVLIAKDGEVVLEKSYGKLEKGGSAAVTNASLYDIASMTKATATAAGIMAAYDEGLFRLDDKVSKHIPALKGTDKENITIRELLYHESGMPATLNMNKVMMDENSYSGALTSRRAKAPYTVKIAPGVYVHSSARKRKDILSTVRNDKHDIEMAKGMFVGTDTQDTIMNRIHNIGLRASKKYLYSCLNFCLLKEMEENLTGVDHDQWVDTEIFGPLGAYNTSFRPLESHNLSEIAATE